MKLHLNRTMLCCAIAVVFALQAAAADNGNEWSPLEGTWRWKFVMSDGGEVSPEVKFTNRDGKLNGISRFRPGSETPVTEIRLTGDQISFEVIRERDGEKTVTSYRGTLSNDTLRGTVTFKSAGAEQRHPWEATRANTIDGPWKWALPGRRPVETKMTLRLDGEKLAGKILTPPPAGARGTGRGDGPGTLPVETEIRNGLFKGDNVSFETERAGADGKNYTNNYFGRLSGDNIVGKMILPGSRGISTNEWRATRGN